MTLGTKKRGGCKKKYTTLYAKKKKKDTTCYHGSQVIAMTTNVYLDTEVAVEVGQ